MSALAARLQSELAAKVQRHGVVIWDDPEGSYRSVVEEVVPASASLYAYTGSWFEFRHQIEKALAGQQVPSLVAYLPAKLPDPDPLEELSAVGIHFRLKLATLIKNTYAGQLTEQRIADLGEQCVTISDAEAALTNGDSSVDARLAALVDDTSSVGIVTAVLSGAHDDAIAAAGLGEVTRKALTDALGGAYGDLTGEALRDAVFRQIVLTCLTAALGDVPEELAGAAAPASASQRKTASTSIARLRTSYGQRYAELAERADAALHLGVAVEWSDALVEVDLTPSIELIGLTEAFRLLDAGEFASAAEIAEARIARSWWTRAEAPTGPAAATRWRAVLALGRLGARLDSPIPRPKTIADVKEWYTAVGWQVDSAYRHSELIRVTSGDALDELDDLFQRARQRYEQWLDDLLQVSSAALSSGDIPANQLQRGAHESHVRKSKVATAYVFVDALRYELAADLAERLRITGASVELSSLVGTPPTITPIGMAAVLPGADTSFRVDLDDNNRLSVSIGGEAISGVKARIATLERAHGKVVDLLLDDVAQSSNKELKKKVANADLVVVRSTEIDSDGESDQLAASWASFGAILSVLDTAVARLLHAGLQRVVITADHGFLAVRQLGDERKIDKPATGAGELHRRAWIGRGGTGSDSTIKLPLAAFGVAGDLDIIAPRGLGVFTAGGGLQFFHGGLSPQELIVPLITVESTQPTLDPQYRIELKVAGGSITTGVVAVALTMIGDLFTSESLVRLQLVQDKERVGVVVGGDGFDSATETIDTTVDPPRVITMQIVRNLVAGSTATLEVTDAATGVQLAKLDVKVAANIIVDDLD